MCKHANASSGTQTHARVGTHTFAGVGCKRGIKYGALDLVGRVEVNRVGY